MKNKCKTCGGVGQVIIKCPNPIDPNDKEEYQAYVNCPACDGSGEK